MGSEKVIEEKKQGQALLTDHKEGNHKKLFIESYGCQMNLNDTEIVASILSKEGYNTTHLLEEADLVLVNTCSIREKAQEKVFHQLPEADLSRVEGDFDDFGMAGTILADLTVGGVLGLTTAVAGDGFADAGNLPVLVFDAPEATGAEGGLFEFRRSGHGLGSGGSGFGGGETKAGRQREAKTT